MKKCPFCAEEIQDAAIKCRWCGEFLSEPVLISKTGADAAASDDSIDVETVFQGKDWYYYDYRDEVYGPFFLGELREAYKKGVVTEYSFIENKHALARTLLKHSPIYEYVKGKQDLETLKASTGIQDLYEDQSRKKETGTKEKLRGGKEVQRNDALLVIGILILIGGVIALFRSLGIDTSVETGISGFGLPSRVNNLGLMNQKQNYIIVSCVALVIGVGVSLCGVFLNKNKQ